MPIWLQARYLRTLILGVVASLLLGGCVIARDPVTGERGAFGYTLEQEIEIGREADRQIVQQFGLYGDGELADYVEDVGQEVLARSPLRGPEADPEYRDLDFTFRVLNSPVVNAFALPGGYVYVTRGLLTHLQNEAQLAVVLGHEIVHVAARHASQRAAKQQFVQLGVIGGAILGQEILGERYGESILQLGGTAAQLLLLRYSRDDEREADRFGVEYAAQTGYEVGEAAGFFDALDRIGELQEQQIPSWLSTHPEPYDRAQAMLELAEYWRPRVEMEVVDQEEYLELLENTVIGPDPREGFVEDGVFFHPDLRFRFPLPAGFQVQNQPSAVIMVEQEQQAALIFAIEPDAQTARAAAATFAQQQGINVLESGPATVSGFPAYYVLANVQTQQGILRALTYYIEYGGRVYTFLGYASPDRFEAYQNAFVRTIQGFDRLTDPAALNVQPVRLEIVEASRRAPFRAYLPENLPPQITAEELAIMNQIELDAIVEPGRLLKLPE